MNINKIRNTLREFQAENSQKFKNTQAELKKAVSYIKKSVSFTESQALKMSFSHSSAYITSKVRSCCR